MEDEGALRIRVGLSFRVSTLTTTGLYRTTKKHNAPRTTWETGWSNGTRAYIIMCAGYLCVLVLLLLVLVFPVGFFGESLHDSQLKLLSHIIFSQ